MKNFFIFKKIILFIVERIVANWFTIPYFTPKQRREFVESGDPVRYATTFLSIEQIKKENIKGNVAECGVFRGKLSKFLHQYLSPRTLYLFDTFSGFSDRDKDNYNAQDTRFQNTSVEGVLKYIGTSNNIVIKKGFFPDTSIGLEHETFCLVVIDFDKYEPTLAALDFFYSRTQIGGFIFIHDYTNPESDYACSRAVDSFLANKKEKVILIPDQWGTAFFRKIAE